MLVQRWRPVFVALAAVVVVWAVALTCYTIAKNSKLTAEKASAYAQSVDLSKLSGAERQKAIRKLTDMLNGLSAEERRKARLDGIARKWFDEMTEEEKAAFLEETMPEGFKQMITAFEQLPEDKRRRAIDDTLRRLKEAQQRDPAGKNGGPRNNGTNAPRVLSKELEEKVRTIGLETFYSQSSAQTKAELAPVLEELQKVMESGRPMRGR
jgi:hypothetical protein